MDKIDLNSLGGLSDESIDYIKSLKSERISSNELSNMWGDNKLRYENGDELNVNDIDEFTDKISARFPDGVECVPSFFYDNIIIAGHRNFIIDGIEFLVPFERGLNIVLYDSESGYPFATLVVNNWGPEEQGKGVPTIVLIQKVRARMPTNDINDKGSFQLNPISKKYFGSNIWVNHCLQVGEAVVKQLGVNELRLVSGFDNVYCRFQNTLDLSVPLSTYDNSVLNEGDWNPYHFVRETHSMDFQSMPLVKSKVITFVKSVINGKSLDKIIRIINIQNKVIPGYELPDIWVKKFTRSV